MNELSTIYIRLLNEGTDVWAPAQARHISSDLWRIVEFAADQEKDSELEFHVGDSVYVETRVLDTGECRVAYRAAVE